MHFFLYPIPIPFLLNSFWIRACTVSWTIDPFFFGEGLPFFHATVHAFLCAVISPIHLQYCFNQETLFLSQTVPRENQPTLTRDLHPGSFLGPAPCCSCMSLSVALSVWPGLFLFVYLFVRFVCSFCLFVLSLCFDCWFVCCFVALFMCLLYFVCLVFWGVGPACICLAICPFFYLAVIIYIYIIDNSHLP